MNIFRQALDRFISTWKWIAQCRDKTAGYICHITKSLGDKLLKHWFEYLLYGTATAGIATGSSLVINSEHFISKVSDKVFQNETFIEGVADVVNKNIQTIVLDQQCGQNTDGKEAQGIFKELCDLADTVEQLRLEIRRFDSDFLADTAEQLRLEIRRFDSDFLATFPLYFSQTAKLLNCDLPGEGNNEIRLDEEHGGVKLNSAHKQQLDLVIDAFKGCRQNDSGGAIQPVKLEITGHSSTTPFRCPSLSRPESDRFNVAAANMRAKNVQNYMEEKLNEIGIRTHFEISSKQWRTYDEMKRPYFDSDEHLESDGSKLLNRSVFIRLLDAGACDI